MTMMDAPPDRMAAAVNDRSDRSHVPSSNRNATSRLTVSPLPVDHTNAVIFIVPPWAPIAAPAAPAADARAGSEATRNLVTK